MSVRASYKLFHGLEVPGDLSSKRVAKRCIACGQWFSIPRCHAGVGKFCSAACRNLALLPLLQSAAVQARALAGYRLARIEGKFPKAKVGPDNPRWTGGKRATYERRQANGKNAEDGRRSRRERPHVAREASKRWQGRKTGRLPKGTVQNLLEMQRGKCANCLCRLQKGFHVDHVVPLAKGGKHEPLNIQLLCGRCNVRKSARDPIVFAQMNGRLL